MAGLVLAMIAGALVPAAVVASLALRDPLPRDCRTGQATNTTVEGALLYSTGQDLWYSEGHPAKARKLVDYAPPRGRPTPGPSPSSAAATAAPSSSPSASPPPAHAPRVVAADISVDRKLVAFLVTDPPDRVGSILLFLVSPLDAGAAAPIAPWGAALDRGSARSPMVRFLDNGKVLFWAPVLPAALPSPSPVVARSPSPAASPSVSAGASPGLTPVPSPGLAPVPSPGVAVVVVAPSPSPTVADQAPEGYFLAQGHSTWTDTKGYRVPSALPAVADRVDGGTTRVAWRQGRDIGTPLAQRRLNEVLVGRAGDASATAVCAAAEGTVPTGFSPDEGQLVLKDGSESLLLDLSGSHAATRLLTGRLLAWR